jgi:23S rRNA (guanosine2251-2'-O)-methyltransferase
VELKQTRGPHESENELRARGIPPPETKPTLAETLRDLRARGIRCIAAHPRADGKTLSRADFTGDCCIVFGSEGDGISKTVLESCDEAMAIPMPPTIDSLNVGAAAAVFLYEAKRQRGFAG